MTGRTLDISSFGEFFYLFQRAIPKAMVGISTYKGSEYLSQKKNTKMSSAVAKAAILRDIHES